MATIKEVATKSGKKSFHVRIRLKGQPLQCATFANISKAREFVQRTEAAIKEGRYFRDAEAKKHTLGEMIDRYIRDALPKKPKSFHKQKMQLLWWKGQLGHMILSTISPALIVEQRDNLGREVLKSGKARSPATVVRYLAALSHAFSIAMKEWGWIEDSPMRKVSKPKESRGRVRFLDKDERSRLLNACKSNSNPYLHIVVVIALSTGMRLSEIMNLSWKDVDFEGKRIVIQETKNGERRLVHLTGLAHEVLLTHSKKRRLDTFLIFPSPRDKDKPASIRAAWENAIDQSNIPDFRFHDLRHSFASELAMGRASLTELRSLLGHKSSSMTARYAHLSESHGESLVDRMTKRIFETEREANG